MEADSSAFPPGFGSEWVTVGDLYRVFVNCRNGFPGPAHAEVLRNACMLEAGTFSGEARIVELFDDDKAGVYCVNVATTCEEDSGKIGRFEESLQELTLGEERDGVGSWVTAKIEVYPKGRTGSDHYDHARHLASLHFTGKSPYAALPKKPRRGG
jgi:hypothetical protein